MIELKTVNREDIICEARFREDMGDIDLLACSMKKEGIIQPLAVCNLENGKYRLLAGGRRYTAAGVAGISEIPVRCYPATLSTMEMRSIELMENVARKDLSWVEATNLKKEIHDLQVAMYGNKVSTSPDATGVSKADTAKLLGVSPGGLSDDIKMASALKVFPQLAQAKTKNDATKLLKALQGQMIIEEIAKRQLAKAATTPLEIQRKTLMDCYIVKDFFEGVLKVPDKSIDIVEIDPPYGIEMGVSQIKRSDDSMQTNTKDYNEIPTDQYIPFLNNLFKECYRVMSENSWLICWFAQEPWFEIVYQSMMRVGFKGARIPAIWNKKGISGQTNQPDCYLGNCYEPFFYVRKGSPSINRQGRKNVFEYNVVNSASKIHPTERPIELIQDIIQTFAWEGARIMVPFLGSGNTLLAASNLGMNGFGFDLPKKDTVDQSVYKDAYILRVNESRPMAYKSYREATNEQQ